MSYTCTTLVTSLYVSNCIIHLTEIYRDIDDKGLIMKPLAYVCVATFIDLLSEVLVGGGRVTARYGPYSLAASESEREPDVNATKKNQTFMAAKECYSRTAMATCSLSGSC